MESYRALDVRIEGPLAEVTLKGPGKGNAMGPDLWRELPEVFGALDRDETVRAVIVAGAGGNFSYGLDLGAAELRPAGELLAAERTRFFDRIAPLQDAITAVEECRKPVLAAVSGWCIGGGLDLIAACDIRLCSEDAKFSLREVRIAIVADLGSLQRLPWIIGEGATRELALTGRDFSAAEALRLGLATAVYASQSELMDAARAKAREIAANPPLAVQGTKRVMNWGRGRRVQDGLDYVAAWNAAFLHSHDLAEAMRAFVEKRAPKFEGR
jgi:enoyl-CoA hydratase